MKLYTNNREREMYDNLADLFSIIKTIEALEKALMRDAIHGDEYVVIICCYCCYFKLLLSKSVFLRISESFF